MGRIDHGVGLGELGGFTVAWIRRVGIAVLLAVVAVSGLSGVDVATAAQATDPGGDVSSVSPDPTNAPPVDVPKPTGIPAGVAKGVEPLPADGGGFVAGRSVVDAKETSPTKLEFVNPDGSRTTELSGSPQRFQASDGSWRDFDRKLVGASTVAESPAVPAKLVGSPDDLVMAGSDVALVLPADPSRGLTRLASPVGEFGLSFDGKTAAPAVDAKDPYVAHYATATDGVSVTVGMLATGFEQSLVVEQPSGPSGYGLTVSLPAGVSARESKSGVEFVDDHGTVVGSFGQGVASDAGKDGGAKARVATTLVSQVDGQASLRVSVDDKWFTNDARVFPVTIDPVWIVSSGLTWMDTEAVDCGGTACNYNHSGLPYLHVGDFGTEWDDSLLTFVGTHHDDVNDPTGGLSRARVSKAELCMEVYSGNNNAASYPANATSIDAFDQTTVTAANAFDHTNGVASTGFVMPTTTTTGQATTSGWTSTCSAPSWDSIDAGPATGYRQERGDNFVSLALWSQATGSGKVFYSAEHPIGAAHPALKITWRREPYGATLTTLANNTTVASTTPTLGATLKNPLEPSADGQTLPTPVNISAWYEVHSGPSTASNTLVASSTSTGLSPGSVVPPWQVPAGVLKDGGSYYWTARVFDNALWNVPTVFRKFTVDRQLGANVVSPTDALGPATVNLATGNLHVSAASQSFPTVGGKLGMKYAYNSLAPSDQGMSIDYYSTPDLTGPITGHEEMSTLWANWAASPPDPAVTGLAGQWSARLSGNFVTTASTSDYKFWVSSGQNVNIKVGPTYEFVGGFLNPLQKLFGHFEPSLVMTSVGPGRHPFTIEFNNPGGAAALDVRLTTSGAAGPPSWFSEPPGSSPMTGSALSTTDNPMPAGWVASPDADGALPYVSLKTEPNAVRLFAADGSSDTFSFDAYGIHPLTGATGTLRVNCGQLPGASAPSCWWDYDDGHIIEHFDFSGLLQWSFNTSDRAHPAAAQYTWATVNGADSQRLTRITDPVSNRYVALKYQNTAKTNCPVDVDPAVVDTTDGYVQPLPGTLCQVDFTQWGSFGGYNQLLYKNTSGVDYLYEIAGLGSTAAGFDREQFVYASGRMTQIRDAAAIDLLGTIPISVQNTDQTKSVIAYDSAGRVSSVTGPEPQPTTTVNAASRAQDTYSYVSASQSTVSQKYATGTRVARTVTFDPITTRLLTDADAAGHVASQTWDNAANAVNATTDAAGVKKTTIFEPFTHRATDSYGPAPASQFNGLVPATDLGTGLPYPIAHALTTYDTNTSGTPWTGLTARYFNTAYLAPDPFGTQAPIATNIYGGTGGVFSSNWATSSAPAGITTDAFSVSYTGLINLDQVPSAGLQWQFAFTADDGILLSIDDQNVTSGWTPGNARSGVQGELPFALTSAGWHKIRVDYQDTGGLSSFSMSYRLGTLGQPHAPGGPGDPHPWVPTGVDHLQPNLGLVTRAIDPDGIVTATQYTDSTNNPGLDQTDGIATKTTVDYGGLNLATASFYEDATNATKFLRQIGSELPKGANTHTDETYYGDTTPTAGQIPASVASGCSAAVSINQGGLVRLHEDADPDGAGSQQRNWTKTYYNRQGLPAYAEQRGDGTWGCIDYDARLRTTQNVTGTSTINTTYSTPGQVTVTYPNPEPGASPSTLTTVTKYDFLGRVSSYQDEHGTLTEPVYDVTGRVVERWQTMLPGGVRTKIWTASYDDDDRLQTTVEFVSNASGRITSYAYDSSGRLNTVNEFSPGTFTVIMQNVIGYSPEGRTNVRWNTSSTGWNWIDTYNTFSPSGNVLTEAESGTQTSSLAYAYDHAGRLTDTTGTRAGVDAYRHYTYDPDTNRTTRCIGPSSAPVCEAAPSYDFADKMTAGPGRPVIDYDTHGNITHYTRTSAADVNITYDDYDHATVINDGSTKTEEWLAPSGRVLHRKVTQLSNGSVTTDVLFGYSDCGDSPAWTIPTGGGTTTTYLGAATIVGTTPTLAVTNLHGDVVATVNASGALTDLPDTDEFGVTNGTIPNTRLGWLGGAKRFTAAPALGIIRMGERLYDPNLGRFLEADPVVGGSCNDYDYVCGDPINGSDTAGTSGYTRHYGLGHHIGSLGVFLWWLYHHLGATFPHGLPNNPRNRVYSLQLFRFPLHADVQFKRLRSGFVLTSTHEHPEGDHRHIKFTFTQHHDAVSMTVHASGPDGNFRRFGLSTLNDSIATVGWDSFAEAIRTRYFHNPPYDGPAPNIRIFI